MATPPDAPYRPEMFDLSVPRCGVTKDNGAPCMMQSRGPCHWHRENALATSTRRADIIGALETIEGLLRGLPRLPTRESMPKERPGRRQPPGMS